MISSLFSKWLLIWFWNLEIIWEIRTLCDWKKKWRAVSDGVHKNGLYVAWNMEVWYRSVSCMMMDHQKLNKTKLVIDVYCTCTFSEWCVHTGINLIVSMNCIMWQKDHQSNVLSALIVLNSALYLTSKPPSLCCCNYSHRSSICLVSLLFPEIVQLLFTTVLFPEYCEKYAKPEDIGAKPEEKSSDEELSEDDYNSDDDQVAGKADPWLNVWMSSNCLYLYMKFSSFKMKN